MNEQTFKRMIASMTDTELSNLSSQIYQEQETRLKQRIMKGEFPTPTDHERNLCSNGKKIDAIKLYHNRTGETIRASKMVIDFHTSV